MLKKLFILILLMALTITAESEQEAELGFTDMVVGVLQGILPDGKFTATEALLLDAKVNGMEYTISLEKPYNFCMNSTMEECQGMFSKWLTGTLSAFSEKSEAESFRNEGLRLGVRTSEYIDNIEKQSGEKVVSRKLAEGLMLICMMDSPKLSRPIYQSELDSLKLKTDKCFETALSNTSAESAIPFTHYKKQYSAKTSELPIGIISGSYYSAGMIAMSKDWNKIAKAFNNKLYVAMPECGTIYYIDGRQEAGLFALNAVAQKCYKNSEMPLTTTLLQWSKGGWLVVDPKAI